MNEREIAQLMIEESPEPIIKNPYLRNMFKPGGLVEPGVAHYARKSPTPINEETFKKIDDFIAKSEGTLSKKALGESLGYKTVEKGQSAGQGGLNKIITAWEKARGKTFEFKPAQFTADSPKVKQVIELFENGMSKKAIEFKTGISRKEIRNIFHQFAPEYIGDANLPGDNTWESQKRRKKIIKELTDYWKDQPGGKKILEEMNQQLRDIKLKNAEIANMSDEAILKNKMFKEAMNLDVRGLKAGEGINFNRYKNLTDAEYVAKVKGLAATNQFYQPEHFIAINKKNPASMLPKNIYTAVGKMGGQMEAMKNFIVNNPKDKRVSEITKLLKSQNIMDSKGILGEGWSKLATKAPKTAGALGKVGRFLAHPVEMGALPLAIAAEGVYSNYASVRDLRKALDEDPTKTDEEKELIVRAYAQENVDQGDVGLEDWAIEQKDTTGVKEELMKMDLDMPTYQRAMNTIIGEWREKEAEKNRRLKELQRQRTKEAWERGIGRQSGGIVGIKLR